MSEQRLKDLLEELVADVLAPDGHSVDHAWQAARRRNRRSHVLVAAGVAAVMVAGTAVVAESLTDGGEPAPAPSPASPSGPERQSPSSRPAAPDTTYGGVPVWWAPPAEDEAGLAWLDSALPRTVDLSPGRPPVEPGSPVLGVFPVHDLEASEPGRFVVLTPDGDTRELDADHVEANRDENGNAAALTPFNGGLSPDGWHLFIAQQSSIKLYAFASGTWTTIDTPDWLAEGARWLDAATIWVPHALGGGIGSTYGVDGDLLASDVRHGDPRLSVTAGDEPYGIWVDSGKPIAGSYFLHGPVDGGPYSNPEGIVARVGGKSFVLALGVDGRGKGCCPVVGWLGEDVVAFRSQEGVLAWQVGTGTLFRVSELTGLEPGKEAAGASWAWQALLR